MTATVQRSDIDALIGQRIHHVLWRRKLQQRDLASKLGITQSTLSRRLRGESAWFAGDLVAVAEALDVSVGWLFGEESAARPKGLEPLTFWTGVWEHTPDVLVSDRTTPESFTCPRCGNTSYHHEDVKQGYCGYCHDWTRDDLRADDLALTA